MVMEFSGDGFGGCLELQGLLGRLNDSADFSELPLADLLIVTRLYQFAYECYFQVALGYLCVNRVQSLCVREITCPSRCQVS